MSEATTTTEKEQEHVHSEECGHSHEHEPAHQPYVNKQPKIGRNEPCPCKSGKKYKKCCGGA